MEKVEVEILGLSSTPSAGGAHALLLKEVFGPRRLPIIIGSFEAQSIALEMEQIKPPRPLSHDLMKSIVDHMGGTVNEIVIDQLKDNTFYAKVMIEISTLQHEIDSRPSDAIALAVRCGAVIYVDEKVMKKASFVPSSESDMFNDASIKSNFEDKEESSSEKDGGQPETKLASLQDKLRQAIENEDYERAAKLRDEISKISGTSN